MGTKPLIFLSPLSERLNQLKESIETTAEEENIEVYDIESLEELNQLIHHIGQFLLLTSSPKLGATFLQINTRKIRKDESKVIIISNKQFPTKIIDRLNKLGLTDLILESVAPKTLQYKVKLQLRSITAQKEEEDDEVHIKHEDEVVSKNEIKKTDEEVASEKEEALNKLKKKILESDETIQKSYPGKASLELDDDIDPDSVVSGFKEDEDEREEPAIESRTLVDVEKETNEKKKNLPWHKAKEENSKAKGSTENINNVWSNKKETGHKENDLDPGSMEGKSNTDKLKNKSTGEKKEKEESIKTHWGGNVKSPKKNDEGDDVEDSSYQEKIDKHYEGGTEGLDNINQDFDTANSKFKENDMDSMAGESKTDQSEGDLKGDSAASKLNNDLLKNDSKANQPLGSDLTGDSKKNNKKDGNMIGDTKTSSINDELEASVDELRKLNNNASLKTDSTLDNYEEEDLKADLGANKKLDRNLTNDATGDKLDHEAMGSFLGNKEEANEKAKRTSLLDQVKQNRGEKKEGVDGFMRSPNLGKKNEEEKNNPKLDEIKTATPIASKRPTFQPSDFAADLFEDNEGVADTEVQETDDLSGASTSDEYDDDLEGENSSEEDIEGMSGETNKADELEDLKGDSNKASSLEDFEGEGKVDQIEADSLYGETEKNNESALDEEQVKKKKKLDELYALREKKLRELAEKKKKEAALSTEEDYYKKDRDWDEKAFSMDTEKVKQNDVNLSQAEYEKSNQENLEAVTYEKSDNENLVQEEVLKKENYAEEVIELRSRHEREEIQIDEGSLTDMERELLNSNKDWGEQTINYDKLKKGGEAFSTDRESSDSEMGFNITEKEIQQEQKIYKGSVIDGDIGEEVTEEEGDKIIHPDSKGLESVIEILNLYFDQDLMPSHVLNKTAELLNKDKGFGVTSFFYKKHGTEEFSEILNGHSLFSNDERLEMWEEDKKQMVEKWSKVKLPTWSDKTFRENRIDFIYPFYEGIDQLGFAVVNFSHGVKQENCQRVEITLEAARAVYLTQRHKENGDEAIYSEKKEIPTHKEKETKKEEGFMKGSDNLIFLEKVKAQKEAEAKVEETSTGFVKKFWKRMFG